MALALTVLAAGFAYAMPRTLLTNAEEDPQQAELVLSPTGSTHTSTATTPRPKKTNDGTDEDGGTQSTENHGAAVSTAAHCDLDGKAHGQFVRSIAHDKDATVAEVEAACAAAQAATATAEDSDDVTHGRGHAKLPKAKHDDDDPDEAVAADDDDEDGSEEDDPQDEADEEDSAESAADDDDASNGGPPEHAKAGKDKP